MGRFFFWLATMIIPLAGISQDINAIFREAEHLESNQQESAALQKYLEVLKWQPSHLQALCKVSELYTITGGRDKSKDKKLSTFQTAKNYAALALRINPQYPDANFVMAIAMGRLALLLNGQQKISAVNDIKKYAEVAIKYDPTSYKAYHVLGKWHYEVSSLNSFERGAVRLFFGGFPSSSFGQSIAYYEKSRTLNPAFALNYLELAKAYLKNDQDDKAREILKRLSVLPNKTADDPTIKIKGNELLKQLE